MEYDLAVFKAFSDETRLRILCLLTEGELCVCELVAVLEMQQGKISRHLAVLKRAGLVADRRSGTWIYYSLRPPDTDLKRRLVPYLQNGRERHSEAVEDLGRLGTLASQGTICVPRPAPLVMAQS